MSNDMEDRKSNLENLFMEDFIVTIIGAFIKGYEKDKVINKETKKILIDGLMDAWDRKISHTVSVDNIFTEEVCKQIDPDIDVAKIILENTTGINTKIIKEDFIKKIKKMCEPLIV